MGGLIETIMGGIMGGKEKPVATPAAVQPAPTTEIKSTAQIQQEEEQKKKAALVAANAGASGQTTTVGGGNADVTRKVLLGL
jgi:hypothetical protein